MIDEKVLLQPRPEALNDKMDMDLQNQKGGCFQQILSPKELVAIYKQIDELGGEFTYERRRNV